MKHGLIYRATDEWNACSEIDQSGSVLESVPASKKDGLMGFTKHDDSSGRPTVPSRFGFALILLLAATTGCTCTPNDGTSDSGRDADFGDTDANIDGDGEIQDSGEVDAESDAEEPELCRGAGPPWSWPPCNDEPNPPDCCPSCRRLTCREMVSSSRDAASIWGDRVVFNYKSHIAMVDLNTGEDRLVFEKHHEVDYYINYGHPVISSKYIVADRIHQPINPRVDEIREAIVARRLDELDGPDILVEDGGTDDYGFIRIYEEWVVWQRNADSGDERALYLHNIETGEQRVLDRTSRDHGFRAPGIWGDRVVWGTRDAIKGETLVEHRISTNTTRDILSDPALEPMYGTSVWENYAVFNHQP